MSDDDDTDFTSANQSSRNLASLFHSGEPAPAPIVAAPPPKQPKKDSTPKIMKASVVQAFSLGADQKWTPRGKMGAALLSTENTIFQLILYLTKTQHVTSARIHTTSVFKCQTNNYLSFQDDGGQNWSIMFDTKQALVDFLLQIIAAKAYLFAFKFDHITQDVREGDGSVLADQDTIEMAVNQYKLLDNGTVSPIDSEENKPIRLKIGKQQNGKTFDDSLRGMKNHGQRVIMIGRILYNVEVIRIKREKEARSSSITMPAEEQLPMEHKRTITEENDVTAEKNKMLQRIHKIGVSMLPNQNPTSAFVHPTAIHLPVLSDDDLVNNELAQNIVPQRSIPTTVTVPPPVQFVPPTYPHHHPSPSQPLIQQPTMYSAPQPVHEYNSRPGSSMSGMQGGMSYQPVPMWPPTQYPQNTPNVPPMDPFYQQQPYGNDFRQLLNRLTEKVDLLNEKFDTKNSTSYPNMETSILLANIQRIVKENETTKKDLFDRSAKVEELNLKISDLLDRNQKLIEKTHLTAEQRNDVANNVSEQVAQKILDLEKQKVELTNILSISTSKIADLQLQINKYTQDTNENQSRVSSLIHQCDQYKEELQKSENQRVEIQMKFDAIQEQLKTEKTLKKQLQTNSTTLEEEIAEIKATCANLEKINNERKTKFENERKRWQDDMDEQKQSYEKELDELRAKLRKQRTNDALTSNQEISRIEQDLELTWQEKLDRQQTQHERILTSKVKELEELKALLNENETKLRQANEDLKESQKQVETYEEKCEKLQERLLTMKERLIEMNDEQSEMVNDRVKRAASTIFQRLKARIRPTKQYNGEEFLARALDIIKKTTLRLLSDNDNAEDQQSTDDEQSDDESEQIQSTDNTQKLDPLLNEKSVDQKTLTEEVSSIKEDHNQTTDTNQFETSSNSPKNGWDTVDDLQQESKTSSGTFEQNQILIVTEDATPSVNQTEITESNDILERKESASASEIMNEEYADNTANQNVENLNENIERNEETFKSEDDETKNNDQGNEKSNKELSPDMNLSKHKTLSDDDDTDDLFPSTRPPTQDNRLSTNAKQSTAPPTYKFNENIPLMTNPDDSEDELFK